MNRRDWLHGLVGRPNRFDVALWIVRHAGDGYFTQRDAVVAAGDKRHQISGVGGLAE